jgi:transcriptional regulator with XRE-family HTH domain
VKPSLVLNGAVHHSEESRTHSSGRSKIERFAAERPDFSDIYERIVDDAVRAYELGPGFPESLERGLLEAPAIACSSAIGRWLKCRLRDAHWSQEELARRIGVDRSAVTRWVQGGSITVKHLTLILLELGERLSDLPVPEARELAVEAYAAAITHTRDELNRRREQRGEAARPHRALDGERFWCLYHLLSEPNWQRALLRNDRALLEQEAARVLRRVSESLGREPKVISNVRDLADLVGEWMEPWVVCLAHLAPRSWRFR